jgi:hypothetical protein
MEAKLATLETIIVTMGRELGLPRPHTHRARGVQTFLPAKLPSAPIYFGPHRPR